MEWLGRVSAVFVGALAALLVFGFISITYIRAEINHAIDKYNTSISQDVQLPPYDPNATDAPGPTP